VGAGTATTHPVPGILRWSLGVTVLVALGAALVVAAATPGVAAADPTDQAGHGDPAVGAFLYGRDCVGCHGVDGLGSWSGPSLEGTGAASNYYVLSTGRMPIAPGEPARRREARYTPDEIDALVTHVTGLIDGPEVPEVSVEDVDLALGGRLYRLHCGVCHSSTGIGVALTADAFAPPVLDSEPGEVAAVMAAGPGAMPAFYPDVFTDTEFDSIVAYVQQLRQPVDQGGLPFGRAGRVDEALAAWGLGILALVLLAGWIARAPGR
jgi:ubiquinol-cytochrome c reductase cytochrome c subunit